MTSDLRVTKAGVAVRVGIDTMNVIWRNIGISPEARDLFSPVPQGRQRNNCLMWLALGEDGETREEVRGVQEAVIDGLRFQLWINPIGHQCLGVMQSVPVARLGHNGRPAWRQELKEYRDDLDKVLKRLQCHRATGERVLAGEGVLQRMDVCLDTVSPRRMFAYLRVFKTIHPPYENLKQRRFYNTSFAMGTNIKRLNGYSKTEQLPNDEANYSWRDKLTREWMDQIMEQAAKWGIEVADYNRQELQLRGSGTLKRLKGWGINTIDELILHFDRLEPLAHALIHEMIFRKTPPRILANVSRKDYASTRKFVRAAFGEADLKIEAAIQRLDEEGYEEALHEEGGEKIKEAERKYLEWALWVQEDEYGVRYGDLYEELKELILPPDFNPDPTKRGRRPKAKPAKKTPRRPSPRPHPAGAGMPAFPYLAH